MAIIITDDDARRLLSMAECIEAMRTAFRDYALGKAVSLPRVRYRTETPDPQRTYFANVHVGAVQSAGMACVRAGSLCILDDGSQPGRKVLANPEPVNWSIVILYDLATAEALALMHESYVSGYRVGATTGAAVQAIARPGASVLGLFGTGRQARASLEAICTVRPITRVQVFSPTARHREAFAAELARQGLEVVPVGEPKAVIEGAHIVCCATNTKQPVFDGDWLEDGQMVISIVNSDVTAKRTEIDETTFARATQIVVNDWPSVEANGQVELLEPIRSGLVDREQVFELGEVLAERADVRQSAGNIVYYKNNTGLGMQFAAAGAIIYKKLIEEGTAKIIPREWLAGENYSQS
jgi:ornithine cyclodeaminase